MYLNKSVSIVANSIVSSGLLVAIGITDAAEAERIIAGKAFKLNTLAGTLNGKLFPSEKSEAVAARRNCYTQPWVAFSFDDVTMAREILGQDNTRLNRFSGKWNWMFNANQSVEYLVQDVETMLDAMKCLNPHNVKVNV